MKRLSSKEIADMYGISWEEAKEAMREFPYSKDEGGGLRRWLHEDVVAALGSVHRKPSKLFVRLVKSNREEVVQAMSMLYFRAAKYGKEIPVETRDVRTKLGLSRELANDIIEAFREIGLLIDAHAKSPTRYLVDTDHDIIMRLGAK